MTSSALSFAYCIAARKSLETQAVIGLYLVSQFLQIRKTLVNCKSHPNQNEERHSTLSISISASNFREREASKIIL